MAGRTLVERLFNNKPNLKMNYENISTVVFSHPPIGVVGYNEKNAKKEYGEDNIVAYTSSFYNSFFSLNANKDEREKSLFKMICLKNTGKIIGI